MATHTRWLKKALVRGAVCGVLVLSLTGCSVFQSESLLIEPEPVVSPQALASADEVFVAEPFSLIAADSVGLATFGLEIARWADMPPAEALAQH